ncbi:MAG: glutathione S-transferase family protein [Hyphomicrobiales bacterium]|nr:glutathione S-transferase family protein [Hyphomicrobiales bacterium]MBV8824561.1 glutathione S-transferase family protein [Hyphomicrobiales bacterium]MBV9426712.1 glutathione S-transferase family protein [Bradyrhizobiaceae bacterium]
MTIEIYAFPPSPRAFLAMALANHLGLDWTLRALDLPKGEHKTAEFAALNPNMRIPTLKEGDYVLWESGAILQYLAGKKPQSGLLPTDETGRLNVTRWQFWDACHWDQACAIYLFENFVKPVIVKGGEPDQAALTRGAELFHRAAKVLDGQLKRNKFVAGDRLTVADFSIGAPLNYAQAARIPLEDYPEITRWYAALRALPAWQKTLAQCGLPTAAAA